MFVNSRLEVIWIAGQRKAFYRHIFIYSLFFFKLWFIPCKAEQPLWVMELQEKEAQKD